MAPSVFLGPAHIISYGVLLGTEVFNSFVAGITSYRALPRAQFATLQSKLFPIYFAMQTALPVVIAFTFPPDRTAIGMSSSGFQGVFEEQQRLHVLTPLAIVFFTSLFNMVYLEGQTTQCMKDRKHQETRDGKKSYDPPPHSKEMQALNSKFMWLHSASSTLNMIGCIATVWYGFYLGARIV